MIDKRTHLPLEKIGRLHHEIVNELDMEDVWPAQLSFISHECFDKRPPGKPLGSKARAKLMPTKTSTLTKAISKERKFAK